MASEASAAEQTTDGQIQEKKVIDDPKVLEGGNVFYDKETGGIGESDGPKVEEQVHPETASTDTGKVVEDGKDEVQTAEEVKKEHDDAKRPTSGDLQDKKDDVLAVVGVKEAVEDVKAFGSEVSANSEDIAENVKEKDEATKISSLEVAEAENLKADKGEKTTDVTESLSEAVENVVVEPEIYPVQDLEQVGQQKEVTEPVTEIAKATEESSGHAADTALVSETVEEKALSAIEPATDATAELEKKDETHTADEVLEVSKDEKVLATEVEIPCKVSKEEPDVKECGNTSARQVLDNDAVREKTQEASDGNSAGGLSLVKELTVDTSLHRPSTVEGEAEPIDDSGVAEAAVKSEIKVESQQEATLSTKPVEEQKEEKPVEAEVVGAQKGRKTLEAMLAEEQEGEENVETQSAEEQKEEKTLKENPTVIAADKTGDLSNPDGKASKTDTEAEKNSGGAGKVAEEQDPGASDSVVKNIEVPTENEKASEAAEAPKDESITDNLTHTSRAIDPEGKKDEVDTFIKEPVDKQEKMEPTVTGDAKDETKDKKDEAKENDTQRLVESSKEDPSSKTEVEAQKSETPKTLISKLKRSIVKVKKAIIGKPPSKKTISAESKDASEVR
ncbi:hypothetical protein Taro_024849 [Colocasia esculenta]|uniref:Uncharacterized protein n=1 Tax=Colocasia esculenta TaxID=4460 RepID=A0A843V7D2_COLES|nr:hypothetical protein [Colocasia esculenta]